MANKKVLEFKLEIAKLEQVIIDLDSNIEKEVERKREINTKKIALIRQGGQREKVVELNKELLEINANILFYQEEKEILKDHIAEMKHEKVVELVEYRESRYKEMVSEKAKMTEELEKLKQEYLEKIQKVGGQAWDLKRELWELNDVIRQHGDGNKFKNPRVLSGIELDQFSAPRPQDGISPFVMTHEIANAIKG